MRLLPHRKGGGGRKILSRFISLPSQRFRGSFVFVCAGLGDWGTSGAAWYLAANWNDLRSRYGESFGIVVEVDIGSDESARPVSRKPVS